ncbi:MAG: DNA internalization-related competence protein ComEC/Rec2 [Candidatus Omnitrophica bacterium]|nr:DNA internalization-related competence protein ComEC/Rec2 [Candidatus Omnitrophota bacterium]
MKRPFLYLFIPFASGIVAARFLHIPLYLAAAFSAIFALLFFVFFKNKILSHIGLYATICALGMAFYANSNILPSDHISVLSKEAAVKIVLRGKVVDDPFIEKAFYGKEKQSCTISVSAYKDNGKWKNARGLVRLEEYSARPAPLQYADLVTAEGFLSSPAGLKNPGLFNYREYLGSKGIYSVFKVKGEVSHVRDGGAHLRDPAYFSYRLRGKIRNFIDRYMDNPYSGFVKAIIIGDRSELPDNIREDFVRTGTVHIIAISGLNLGIIAAIILFILGIAGVPKRANLIITLIAIAIYSITAGASPPVVRASIVFAVYVIGYLIRRDADMLNSLAIAGFFILAYNPKELFDPSFQLSFSSVASIIVLTPRIQNILMIKSMPREGAIAKLLYYALTSVAVSLAAWAGTWPIVVTYFNIVSPVSILANIVIVPALFVLTVAVFGFLLSSLLPGVIPASLAYGAELITRATFFINGFFAKIPLSYFRIGAPETCMVVIYYALIGSLLIPRTVRLGRINFRRSRIIIAMLIAANILTWQDMFFKTRDKLRLTFLDVGQGDSVVLELPSGGNVIIDGGTGTSAGRFDIGKNVVAPYLWNRGIYRLNYVVVTHFHEDHIGGIVYVLENFKVDNVIDAGAPSSGSASYSRYLSAIKRKGIRRIKVREGDVLELEGSRFFILNPQKGEDALTSNDDSIVAKLVSGPTSVLFCGDIQEKSIKRILSYGEFLRSDIIKIPHHGSNIGDENTVRNFLKIVSPQTAVISNGSGIYGDVGNKPVIDALTSLNIMSYETKDAGAVILYGK